jgi:hypothetical protein
MTDRQAPDDRQRPRRQPRAGDSRAPVTTIVVLASAAVAVIAGLLILRSVTDQSVGSDPSADDVTGTTVAAAPASTGPAPTTAAPTTTSTSTTTTTIARTAAKSDAVVVVANASGVGGSATAMAAALAAAGYTTAPVANSPGARLERSVIYYVAGDAAAQGVAGLLAQQIPTAQTQPMPAAPPLDRPLGSATVALLLGLDAAGKPLGPLPPG